LKKLLLVALIPFPSKVKILVFRRVLGFDVAVDPRIRLSFVVLCQNLIMGSGAAIEHMKSIKGNILLRMSAMPR
jgi:hypothetical protein